MNKKYQINTEENRRFLEELRLELLEFGRQFLSEGGGSYYLGDDGTPWKDRPRETWITCRMTHVYSIGKMLGVKGCDELAAGAIKGLLGELCDEKNGGWFSGVDAGGKNLPDKQCYAHAFVILAGTSGILAGIDGAEELLERALKTFDEKFWNEEEGLTVDTWNTEFDTLSDYRGINANMHTVEAFLAAADALCDEKYRVRAGRIIEKVIGWAKDNDWRIPEHFTSQWVPELEYNKENKTDQFKPYGATPGHGIEWARLIVQWATSTFVEDETEADSYIDAAVNLYNQAVKDGWARDGKPGLAYTTDWQGNPIVKDRMHWTLAEAINTSAILAGITGEDKYCEDYAMFMEYLDDTVHDKVNGSWFHQLDENNEVIGTVWPGKSDLYHAFQATLIPYSDYAVSIAAAVAEGEQA